MKRLLAALLTMLLVFSILTPVSVIAEGLEIEQITAGEEGIELL